MYKFFLILSLLLLSGKVTAQFDSTFVAFGGGVSLTSYSESSDDLQFHFKAQRVKILPEINLRVYKNISLGVNYRLLSIETEEMLFVEPGPFMDYTLDKITFNSNRLGLFLQYNIPISKNKSLFVAPRVSFFLHREKLKTIDLSLTGLSIYNSLVKYTELYASANISYFLRSWLVIQADLMSYTNIRREYDIDHFLDVNRTTPSKFKLFGEVKLFFCI